MIAIMKIKLKWDEFDCPELYISGENDLLAGFFFSIPSIGYVIETNVRTGVPILGNSLFIVVCNSLLAGYLLPKVAFGLATLRRYGRRRDIISFNKARVEALYCVQFMVQVVAPAAATFVFYEVRPSSRCCCVQLMSGVC